MGGDEAGRQIDEAYAESVRRIESYQASMRTLDELAGRFPVQSPEVVCARLECHDRAIAAVLSQLSALSAMVKARFGGEDAGDGGGTPDPWGLGLPGSFDADPDED